MTSAVAVSRPQPGEENLRKGAHRVDVEPTPRRVRVVFNGQTIADSKRAVLLRESNLLPVYYFPPEDVRGEFLEATEQHTRCPYKGEASYWTIKVGDKVAENAMWGYLDPLPGREQPAARVLLPARGCARRVPRSHRAAHALPVQRGSST